LKRTLHWRRENLAAPTTILNVTDENREEMDLISNFINERCIKDGNVTIWIRELYKAYSDWCDDKKEHAVSERFVTMRLKEIGFEQCKTVKSRYWFRDLAAG